MGMHPKLRSGLAAGLFMLLIASAFAAAVAQSSNETMPLTVRTTSLPKALVRQPYDAHLEAQGGVQPLKWEVTEGNLPAGLLLQFDGHLTGTPTVTGEFRFTVTVSDSGKPAFQRQQQLSLLVVAPLLAQWGRVPKVNGQRIEGSVIVSNETYHDFDLTAIVLAVNEIGRATAIGYQRFPLKANAGDTEIPFGENLPPGSYEVNVDVVAEVAETNSIYRARLLPKDRLQVVQGP